MTMTNQSSFGGSDFKKMRSSHIGDSRITLCIRYLSIKKRTGNEIRGYASFTLTEFTISAFVFKLHMFLRTSSAASALICYTGLMKQMILSAFQVPQTNTLIASIS